MKTIATVLFASLITFAACKKEDKKAVPTPTTAPAGSAAGSADAAKLTEAPKAADMAAGDAPKADPTGTAAIAGAVMTVDQAGEMATSVMTKFADAVNGANGDCPKMAISLVAIKGDMEAMMKAGKAFDADAAKKKEFDEKFGKQLSAVMMPAMGGLMKCQGNADVTNFMKSMDPQ